MRRGKVVIERERCKGCYLCVAHCPFGVLAADTAMNGAGVYPSTVKNPEKCTACAACHRMCPDTALTVYELEEGES